MEGNLISPKTNEEAVDKAELASAVEARRLELQNSFAYAGYQVVRKELFAHYRDPAITIRPDSVTFNMACIAGLEDVIYIQILINEALRRIVVLGCDENDKDALRWCIPKEDKRKSRKMTCREFADGVYSLMNWDRLKRYKILGYKIEFEKQFIYIFDLNVTEIFDEPVKKKKGSTHSDDDSITYDDESGSEPAAALPDEEKSAVNTRKGYYPDSIRNTFGVSVEDHKKESEISEMGGYVSMGMLNEKSPSEKNG